MYDFIYKYHLEYGIELAFTWDISDHSIRFTGEIIDEKEVLTPQDFLDGIYMPILRNCSCILEIE